VTSATCKSPDYDEQDEDDEAIDPDTCCMCFGDGVLESIGAEWINCRCGKWMHEDCVEETVMDSDGHQRFCTFCADKYTV